MSGSPNENSDDTAWSGLPGTPYDCAHAAHVAAWLQSWLSRAAHDLDPSITAFVAACAENERVALASVAAPEDAIDGSS